jgi:hypothetical protein
METATSMAARFAGNPESIEKFVALVPENEVHCMFKLKNHKPSTIANHASHAAPRVT